MSMNPTLAAMYNTNGFGDRVRQEQTKIAHLDLFAKSAAANGIDLSQLDANTRQALYQEFSMKLAEESPEALEEEGKKEEHEGEEEKEEGEKKVEKAEEEEKEAAAQFQAMQQWQQKVAEADYLGRVMAHSFTDERTKIASQTKRAEEEEKKDEEEHKDEEEKKEDEEKHEAPKEASAFDRQAARHAEKIAQAAGLNVKTASKKIAAVLMLGAPPTTKTAMALNDYGTALNVRALELLEAAKYPVDWNQVFGR